MSTTEPQQPALFPDPAETAQAGAGAIEQAAALTIDALREHGGLDATHALKVQLIVQGARALDRELRRPKVSVAAIALFSRVTDIADGLPTVQKAVNEQWERITETFAHDDDAPAEHDAAALEDA